VVRTTGPRADATGAYGANHRGGVCKAVSQEREERCQRRGGDLHRGAAGEHAVRGDEMWIGLTPKPHSTGGNTRLGQITKRGDAHLRPLLILGAKSASQAALR
jgi:hypothetical protein